MSKDYKIRLLAIIAGTVLWGVGYFYFTDSNFSSAIQDDLQELEVSQNYKIVQVPNSKYVLVITKRPHQVIVFKNKNVLWRNYVTFEGRVGTFGTLGASFFVDDYLQFGFRELKKDESLTLKEAKINIFSIGKYFKESKLYDSYKNLVFYFPDEPVKVKRNLTEPLFVEDKDKLRR